MVAEPFIICENLVKIYKLAELEVVALQGLDLSVARGELLGVVGASGSGKTTLMNILGGLDRPSAGRVWIDGADLFKLDERALTLYRRRQVGFVWQQAARNLVPYLNALENVLLPLQLSGATSAAARQRAQMLLEMVGLRERGKHHLAQLSGGEQQRVAIAVALANNPPLLLADEPTGEVDTPTAVELYRIFRELSREFGLTVVLVSHDPTLARYVDRVVAVRDGKLASETIRKSVVPAVSGETSADAEVFHEMVVLDSAGRLQVPREYLERFGIKRRAQLEVTAEGILIRPVEHAGAEAVGAANRPPAEMQPRSDLSSRLRHWLRRRFSKG